VHRRSKAAGAHGDVRASSQITLHHRSDRDKEMYAASDDLEVSIFARVLKGRFQLPNSDQHCQRKSFFKTLFM